MNDAQISLLSVIEEKRVAEKPYFNGLGEPLPWEDLCGAQGHSPDSCIYPKSSQAYKRSMEFYKKLGGNHENDNL